mmetsp:Transcript_1296/g.3156  ORF Transcript_1296/g.3156 Transcript_1296/m.3156 type:complete len:899 (-) Transcript_1296:1006-3702(-)
MHHTFRIFPPSRLRPRRYPPSAAAAATTTKTTILFFKNSSKTTTTATTTTTTTTTMKLNKIFKEMEGFAKGGGDAKDYTQAIPAMIGEEEFLDTDDAVPEQELSMNPTRWEKAVVALSGIVKQVSKVDPDGLDIICFGGTDDGEFDEETDKAKISVFRNVKAPRDVEKMVTSKIPSGPCIMGKAMDYVLKKQFETGFDKRPCGILVLTAGQPDDSERLEKTLKAASERIAREWKKKEPPLTITFMHIGDDEKAEEYMKFLSDKMVSRTRNLKTRQPVDIVDAISDKEIQDTMKEIGTKPSGKAGAVIGAFAGAAMGVGGMYVYNKNQAKKRTKGWNGKWKAKFEGHTVATLEIKDDLKGRLEITGFPGGKTHGRYYSTKKGYSISFRDADMGWKIDGEIENEHTIYWGDGTRWDEIPPEGGSWGGYAAAGAAGAAGGGAIGYLLDKKFFNKASKEDQCDYVIMVDRSAMMRKRDKNTLTGFADDDDDDDDREQRRRSCSGRKRSNDDEDAREQRRGGGCRTSEVRRGPAGAGSRVGRHRRFAGHRDERSSRHDEESRSSRQLGQPHEVRRHPTTVDEADLPVRHVDEVERADGKARRGDEAVGRPRRIGDGREMLRGDEPVGRRHRHDRSRLLGSRRDVGERRSEHHPSLPDARRTEPLDAQRRGDLGSSSPRHRRYQGHDTHPRRSMLQLVQALHGPRGHDVETRRPDRRDRHRVQEPEDFESRTRDAVEGRMAQAPGGERRDPDGPVRSHDRSGDGSRKAESLRRASVREGLPLPVPVFERAGTGEVPPPGVVATSRRRRRRRRRRSFVDLSARPGPSPDGFRRSTLVRSERSAARVVVEEGRREADGVHEQDPEPRRGRDRQHDKPERVLLQREQLDFEGDRVERRAGDVLGRVR